MAKKRSPSTRRSKTKKGHRVRNYRDFYINPDCSVDPPDQPNPPYVKYSDQVRWHSRGGNFAIVFVPNPPNPYVSPFNDSVFVVKATGVTNPGAIKIKQDLYYRYCVVGDSGCGCGKEDPIIHIGP